MVPNGRPGQQLDSCYWALRLLSTLVREQKKFGKNLVSSSRFSGANDFPSEKLGLGLVFFGRWPGLPIPKHEDLCLIIQCLVLLAT
jgi:hypothetical protein